MVNDYKIIISQDTMTYLKSLTVTDFLSLSLFKYKYICVLCVCIYTFICVYTYIYKKIRTYVYFLLYFHIFDVTGK